MFVKSDNIAAWQMLCLELCLSNETADASLMIRTAFLEHPAHPLVVTTLLAAAPGGKVVRGKL